MEPPRGLIQARASTCRSKKRSSTARLAATISRERPSTRSRIFPTDIFGSSDATSAATPATNGEAIDVPLIVVRPPKRNVLHTDTPGAPISTEVAP